MENYVYGTARLTLVAILNPIIFAILWYNGLVDPQLARMLLFWGSICFMTVHIGATIQVMHDHHIALGDMLLRVNPAEAAKFYIRGTIRCYALLFLAWAILLVFWVIGIGPSSALCRTALQVAACCFIAHVIGTAHCTHTLMSAAPQPTEFTEAVHQYAPACVHDAGTLHILIQRWNKRAPKTSDEAAAFFNSKCEDMIGARADLHALIFEANLKMNHFISEEMASANTRIRTRMIALEAENSRRAAQLKELGEDE